MQGTTTETYRVVSAGKPLAGQSAETVRAALAERFKLSDAKLQRVLSKPTLLKQGLDATLAQKYLKALRAAGLDARLLKDKPAVTPESAVISKAAKPEQALSLRELEALFDQPIPRLPVGLAYKAGLAGVALLSLVAPLIYFGLVALVAVGLVSYLFAMPGLLDQTSSLIASVVIVTFVPFICGTFLLFLARPLFIRFPQSRALALDPRKYRRFYDLVEVLCDRMGLPAIKEIRIDNAVNASMGPSNGFTSLLRRELTLTVGMPLVAGFSSRQLVGVISHELGHFAQPMAMITNYVVNNVNFWMANRAFEDDPWDTRLAAWHQKSPFFFINVMLWLTQAMIWLTRRLFKGLFHFNMRVTRHMSRQMEYDADRYECWVAGSDLFAETARRLHTLGYAASQVHQRNVRAWGDGKLMENLPDGITRWADDLGEDELRAVLQQMDERQTALWDTHPADNDRIDHAEAAGFAGVYRLDLPARALLPRFDDLCRIATIRDYIDHGISEPEQYLTANAEVLAISQSRETEDQSLESYYNGTLTLRFLKLGAVEAGDHQLQDVVDQIRGQIPRYRELNDQYFNLLGRHNAQVYGCNFLETGITIVHKQFHLPGQDVRAAKDAIAATSRQIEHTCKQMGEIETLFGLRMKLAILAMPADEQERAKALFTSLRQFYRLLDPLRTASSFGSALEGILSEEHEKVIEAQATSLDRATQGCREGLMQVIQVTAKVPLEINDKARSLRELAANNGVTGCGADENLAEMPLAPVTVLQTLDQLRRVIDFAYYRTVAELTLLCEVQEKRLNIRPLRLARVDTGEATAA